MPEDYHIHGGIIETINCQGNVIMHGGVVESLNVQGDCKQYGGIIEHRILQQTQNPTTRVVYKDRIIYRDRVKVVYRDRPGLKPGMSVVSDDDMRELYEQAKYWLKKADELEVENTKLKKEIEATERQKLLREIDDLKEKLNKARQRENVAVLQRKDAEREALIAKSQVWDDFKPTKEQVKSFYKIITNCMDCETDY
jgi:hypothetical protein